MGDKKQREKQERREKLQRATLLRLKLIAAERADKENQPFFVLSQILNSGQSNKLVGQGNEK